MIKEKDLTTPILTALYLSPTGFLTTSQIIRNLENWIQPTGKDNSIILGRSDTYFSQKVRNVICHRFNAKSPIACGLIRYKKQLQGLEITQIGRDFLKDET